MYVVSKPHIIFFIRKLSHRSTTLQLYFSRGANINGYAKSRVVTSSKFILLEMFSVLKGQPVRQQLHLNWKIVHVSNVFMKRIFRLTTNIQLCDKTLRFLVTIVKYCNLYSKDLSVITLVSAPYLRQIDFHAERNHKIMGLGDNFVSIIDLFQYGHTKK